jgi:hypothetical protein
MDHVPAPAALPHPDAHAHGVLLAASNVPFAIIFGIFVVALVAMIVITLMWAVRRDRPGRAAWRQHQEERIAGPEGDVPPAPHK